MSGQTYTSYKPTPAIVRDVCQEDEPTTSPIINGKTNAEQSDKIISEPTDTVTHNRGWGDSGYRVQVVNHECPECGFDRMVRRIDVSPGLPNEVRYWCLHPNCVHFVGDSLSYACHGNYPQRDTSTPAVFEPL